MSSTEVKKNLMIAMRKNEALRGTDDYVEVSIELKSPESVICFDGRTEMLGGNLTIKAISEIELAFARAQARATMSELLKKAKVDFYFDHRALMIGGYPYYYLDAEDMKEAQNAIAEITEFRKKVGICALNDSADKEAAMPTDTTASAGASENEKA